MNVIRLASSPYDANSYLVEGSILIDAGMDAETVVSELEKHIRPEDLKIIVLTHCHYDHSGAAGEIAELTGAKIAIHKQDAASLGDSNASVSAMFGRKAPGITPDLLLSGGEILDGLEVIHSPGHTPGGICLYNSDSGILFSGDLIFPDGGFGRTDLYGGNSQQLIESIKKISHLDIRIMYPGHGDIVDKDAIEHIKMSLFMAGQYSLE